MQQKIKVFGQLAEITGTAEITLPKSSTTADLKKNILENYPALASFSFMIAVDKSVLQGDALIPDNAEIALLPPFSGG